MHHNNHPQMRILYLKNPTNFLSTQVDAKGNLPELRKSLAHLFRTMRIAGVGKGTVVAVLFAGEAEARRDAKSNLSEWMDLFPTLQYNNVDLLKAIEIEYISAAKAEACPHDVLFEIYHPGDDLPLVARGFAKKGFNSLLQSMEQVSSTDAKLMPRDIFEDAALGNDVDPPSPDLVRPKSVVGMKRNVVGSPNRLDMTIIAACFLVLIAMFVRYVYEGKM